MVFCSCRHRELQLSRGTGDSLVFFRHALSPERSSFRHGGHEASISRASRYGREWHEVLHVALVVLLNNT